MSKLLGLVLAGATATSLAFGASSAFAQTGENDSRQEIMDMGEARRFGQQGQWTFSTDAAFSFERRTQSNTDAVTTLSLLPAADYFVIGNLSVGGMIGVQHQRQGDNKSTAFLLGPRVGYNIGFNRWLSLWPRVGFSYSRTKSEASAGSVGSSDLRIETTNNAMALNLFAPFLLHPAQHFFAGLGPFLDTDLNGDNRATTWGVRLTIGGWI